MKFMRQAARTPASFTIVKTVGLAGVGMWACAAAPAYANPADLFGLGAREISMGNAFTAVADDPFAAYYNMGGLAQIKRLTVTIGVQGGSMRFGDPSLCAHPDGVGCSEQFYYNQGGVETLQQKRYGYDAPVGTHISFAIPVLPKLNFGTVAYLPTNVEYDEDGNFAGLSPRLTRFMTIDPYMPDYVLYQNRPQRFSAYVGFSYEVVPGLGIGVGAAILARASIGIDAAVTATVDEVNNDDGTTSTSAETAVNTLMTMELGPKLTPVAGVLWNLGTLAPSLQPFQIGLTYRGTDGLSAETDISTDITATVTLGEDEAPYTYNTSSDGLAMSIVDHYTPQQAAMGISALFADRVRLAADLTWTNWAAFQVPVVTLPESIPTDLGVTLSVTNARKVETDGFRDTFTPRFGVEGRLGPYFTGSKLKGVDLYLRAGGGFERNPFGEQTGLNNLLNSDRVMGSGGLGITTHNPLSRERDLPVSLDFAMQGHYLIPTKHVKQFDPGTTPPDGYPVDGVYVSQGLVLQGALTLQLGF